MRDIVFILARNGYWVTYDGKHILVASFRRDVVPDNVANLLLPCGHAARYNTSFFFGYPVPTTSKGCLPCQIKEMTDTLIELEKRASNYAWAQQHPDYAERFPNTLAYLNGAIRQARQLLWDEE